MSFYKRCTMFTQADIETQLYSALPFPEQKEYIPLLASLLIEVVNGKLAPDVVQTHLPEQFNSHFSIAIAAGENSIAIGRDNNGIIVSIKMPEPPNPEAIKKRTLETAKKRFAELPTDTLPFLLDELPPHSRMQLRRNPFFVGRQDELLALARKIKGNQAEKSAVVINGGEIVASTGIGGIGKTQLANEFVHRYGQFFGGGVFWLSFADASLVPAEVIACGGPDGLDLPGFSNMSPKNQMEAVKAAWRNPIPRLLVFDNCEDEKLLHEWSPATGGCRILVTSRNAKWAPFLKVQMLALPVLKREQSIELLRKFRPDLPADDPDLNAIAEQVGDLPLALHLAGSYLSDIEDDKDVLSPASYLAHLRDPPSTVLKDESFRREGISPTDHLLNLQRTFDLSYERLDMSNSIDQQSQAALARAAYFAPGEPIPRPLLRTTLNPEKTNDEANGNASKAFNRLVRLGLLERSNEKTLSLHRLIAFFTRDVVETPVGMEAQASVENVILDTIENPKDAGYSESLLPFQVHLPFVVGEAFKRYLQTGQYDAAAYVQLALDPYLVRWGAYRLVLERHEQLQDKITFARYRLFSLSSLGNAYLSLGEHQKAFKCYNAALHLAREGTRKDDEGGVLGSLGNLHQITGRTEDAILHYWLALDIAQELEDKNTEAKWLINLGICYHELGQTTRAMDCLTQALSIALTYEDQGIALEVVARCEVNIGNCLSTSGQVDLAIEQYQKALDIAIKNGDKQTEALCRGNLGDSFSNKADFERAHLHLKQALSLCQMYELKDNQGNVLHSLAELLIDTGYYDQALKYAHDGLRIGQEIAHPVLVNHNATALARAHLLTNDLSAAYNAALVAQRANVPLTQHYALILLGITSALREDGTGALDAFHTVLQQTAVFLQNNPKNCTAYDTQALASYGIALYKNHDNAAYIRAAYDSTRSSNQDIGTIRRIQGLFNLLGKQLEIRTSPIVNTL
jgi:tetratricopeptide (TPR) repeat protein